jgi:hypothetical protein
MYSKIWPYTPTNGTVQNTVVRPLYRGLQGIATTVQFNSLICLNLSVNCPKAFKSPTIHPDDVTPGVERQTCNMRNPLTHEVCFRILSHLRIL